MNLWMILIPLWSANSALNIWWELRRRFGWPDWPLDGGKVFVDGKRIFGDSKTILGLPIAVFFGWMGGNLVGIPNSAELGACTWIGAVISGFIKRRIGISTHEKFPILDQSDYFFTALIFEYVLGNRWGWGEVLIVWLGAMCVHWLTNKLAFFLKLRTRDY